MRNDKASMDWQRKVLALMGFLLPILSVVFGFIAYEKNGSEFWWSISATFYATSNIFMIGTLSVFAFFLWCYKGYDIGDDATTKISAILALMILIFPCECQASGTTTGVLNLPTNVSHYIHCLSAGLLFGSFAYMIGCRFTLRVPTGRITDQKRKRDHAYNGCACLIVVGMITQVVTSLYGIGWMTIVNETVMLWAFSLAWYIKAGGIKKLNDV